MLKKFPYIVILFLVAFFLAKPSVVKATTAADCLPDASDSIQNRHCIAVYSAQMMDTSAEATNSGQSDMREEKLRAYLEQVNSPLKDSAHHLIEVADTYELPWTLIPAISGVESTFCQHIPVQSYNCWGWNGGATHFASYDEAITIVGKTLRTKYFDRGYSTPARISPIYAPPSTTWAGNVNYFMDKIERHQAPAHLTLQMAI